MTNARARWKLLQQTVIKCSVHENSSVDANKFSVRRHKSFDLFEVKKVRISRERDDALWQCYSCSAGLDISINIRNLKNEFSAEDLIGFNNTGNVCLWPSEEVLAYLCLKRTELFRDKHVCELGGGMTCLGGLMVAVCSEAAEVLLTDGNSLSCKNVETIVKENQKSFGSTEVSVREVKWNDPRSYHDKAGQYDIIICADCLFFDEYRNDLLQTIKTLLKPGGFVWLLAPLRGATLMHFCNLAKIDFNVELIEQYDQLVWDKHLQALSKNSEQLSYDKNIHYPWLMVLSR